MGLIRFAQNLHPEFGQGVWLEWSSLGQSGAGSGLIFSVLFFKKSKRAYDCLAEGEAGPAP